MKPKLKLFTSRKSLRTLSVRQRSRVMSKVRHNLYLKDFHERTDIKDVVGICSIQKTSDPSTVNCDSFTSINIGNDNYSDRTIENDESLMFLPLFLLFAFVPIKQLHHSAIFL